MILTLLIAAVGYGLLVALVVLMTPKLNGDGEGEGQ
jgi:hypothetical protein